MRLGRTWLRFALALIWLAMPVHCQLEAFPGASLLACSSNANAGDSDCQAPSDSVPNPDCEEDFCDSLESGNYFPQKVLIQAKVPLLRLLVALPEPIRVDEKVPDLQDWSGETSLLPNTWQFVLRTAVPVRAPSFIS